MFTQHEMKKFYQLTSLQEKLNIWTTSPPHSGLLPSPEIPLMESLRQTGEPLQNLGTYNKLSKYYQI